MAGAPPRRARDPRLRGRTAGLPAPRGRAWPGRPEPGPAGGAAAGATTGEAAGGFLDRYAARFDLAPVPAYDYAEIIRIAAGLLDHGAVRDRERKAYDVVMVDEYQDTDPAQEELLHALAGDGRELIAVGDPDQSIYAFRGADVHGIARFPERFRTPDDRLARVVALRTCRTQRDRPAGGVPARGEQAASRARQASRELDRAAIGATGGRCG